MKRQWRREWRMRHHLAALLVATMALTFALVGGALMAWRIPRIEQESWTTQQHAVQEMRSRMELLLHTRLNRLKLIEALVDDAPAREAPVLLDSAVHDGSVLHAVYRVSPRGRITAVGLPPFLRDRRNVLVGRDLSADRLFQAVNARQGEAWSGQHLSVLTGQSTVALAFRDHHGDVLIGEFPLSTLLHVVKVATSGQGTSIWVVDRGGQVIADTRQVQDVGPRHIPDGPLMQHLLQGREGGKTFSDQGSTFRLAVSHSPALDWYFVGRTPAGLENPRVRTVLVQVAGAFGSCLLIGLATASFWARRMARPLQEIIARTVQTTSGADHGTSWPKGSVAEFNRLSSDLETMTETLQERERTSHEILHASPVPMAVADLDDDYRLLDVNHVWCSTFLYRREEVVGRTTRDIDLWVDPHARVALNDPAENGETIEDAWFRRSDGSTVLVRLHGRMLVLRQQRLLIWAAVDIGPIRRIKDELRTLNHELEARVERRSQALAASNAALSQTVEQLRAARHELVRAEKLAALGSLVAGVAHELNTPLGNGVLAVSALADATRGFQAAMQAGVRRSDLQQFMAQVERGTDIAARNLHRAADLVQNFKQVAVDQTSAQRRSFELGEIVHEMVVSLRPSFSRTPYRIVVDVPATGLRMDSYPGALGQVIGNLVQNAVVHGFDGRNEGIVRIEAARADPEVIVLRVHDDGRGIAASHIDRIFDPFMTTKMGQGGTGLGLHISYNAVTNLLGGSIMVHSTEGLGTCFEVRLPPSAPHMANA